MSHSRVNVARSNLLSLSGSALLRQLHQDTSEGRFLTQYFVQWLHVKRAVSRLAWKCLWALSHSSCTPAGSKITAEFSISGAWCKEDSKQPRVPHSCWQCGEIEASGSCNPRPRRLHPPPRQLPVKWPFRKATPAAGRDVAARAPRTLCKHVCSRRLPFKLGTMHSQSPAAATLRLIFSPCGGGWINCSGVQFNLRGGWLRRPPFCVSAKRKPMHACVSAKAGVSQRACAAAWRRVEIELRTHTIVPSRRHRESERARPRSQYPSIQFATPLKYASLRFLRLNCRRSFHVKEHDI